MSPRFLPAQLASGRDSDPARREPAPSRKGVGGLKEPSFAAPLSPGHIGGAASTATTAMRVSAARSSHRDPRSLPARTERHRAHYAVPANTHARLVTSTCSGAPRRTPDRARFAILAEHGPRCGDNQKATREAQVFFAGPMIPPAGTCQAAYVICYSPGPRIKS
jgi:hypothetical protein